MAPRRSPLTPLVCLLLTVLAAATVLAPQAARAQDKGTVAGVVVDSETGETLIGANVALLPADTTDAAPITGAATDLDGAYRIRIAPGTYNVRYTYIGYQPKTVSGVEVTAGTVTNLEVSLAPDTAELEEVVVTVEAARDSEAGLLKQRQKASAVSDAISAEAIGRSGSSNAADAMQRVTGASVQGGKYVSVRGLGGRYASTQLNGVNLPSSDPERKAVQFDLFPAALLESIVTLKTFTPDRPGNFSGGSVNINTRSFPRQFSLTYSSSLSFNTQTHFNDDFLTFSGGRLDWLGFDDGTRQIPSLLRSLDEREIPDAPIFVSGPEEAERYSQIAKAFEGELAPTRRTAPIGQRHRFSVGNQSALLGRPLGYVLSLSYRRDASFYGNGTTGRYELGGSNDRLRELLLLNDQSSTEEATLGAVANASYKLTPNHQIGLDGLYTHTGTSSTRFQEGRWVEVNEEDDFRNRTLTFQERSVFSLKLNGKSYFESLNNALVEWRGARARTTQEEPDRRFFASIARVRADGDTLFSAFDQGLRPPARVFRDLVETRYTAGLDVTLPVEFRGRGSNLKAGVSYNDTRRSFSERFFSYNAPEVAAGIEYNGNPDAFFAEENLGIVGTDANGNPVFGLTIDPQTNDFSSYEGDRTIAAGYLMGEVPVTDRLRVITGARVEATDLAVQATADSVGRIEEIDLLPSLNVVYQLRENMNLRAAATRTLARPTFREIAPYPSFNFVQAEVIIGNPNLQRVLITNFDLRWEWFRRPGEVAAVSLYYKALDDPIERAFIGSSSNTGNQLTWRNVDQATVYGAEFEARTRLDYISPLLRDVTLGGNLSFTRSQVDVPCLEFEEDGVTCERGELVFRQVNNESSTRDLQGQSPYLANLNLNYNNQESGTSAGLFLNVFGERLSIVSTGATPDVFEQPQPQLDFVLSQRLLQGWSAKLRARNILNPEIKQTYTFEGEELIYQRFQRGRTFSLGLSYNY